MKIIWIFSVVGLLRTGSTYVYRVGDCRVYTWVVAVENEEGTILVPTLHTWNIHSRYVNMHKEKFNRKEKGKEVDVYYSEQQKKAVIKEKTVGMYINIWGGFLFSLEGMNKIGLKIKKEI